MSDPVQSGGEQALSALLHEIRHFDPPAEFAAQANAQPAIYEGGGPRTVWHGGQSRRSVSSGIAPSTPCSSGILPSPNGLSAGKLNASVNCVRTDTSPPGNGDKVAYHWVRRA